MVEKPRRFKKKKEEYRMRTHLIHGNFESKRWDYDHHLIPPISSSTTYRLSSTHRGVQGFLDFSHDEMDTPQHVPIYIYDRLDEPTRGMLEENLAYAEGGESAVSFATGMFLPDWSRQKIRVARGVRKSAIRLVMSCRRRWKN